MPRSFLVKNQQRSKKRTDDDSPDDEGQCYVKNIVRYIVYMSITSWDVEYYKDYFTKVPLRYIYIYMTKREFVRGFLCL